MSDLGRQQFSDIILPGVAKENYGSFQFVE
jgi:hypothetical protein